MPHKNSKFYASRTPHSIFSFEYEEDSLALHNSTRRRRRRSNNIFDDDVDDENDDNNRPTDRQVRWNFSNNSRFRKRFILQHDVFFLLGYTTRNHLKRSRRREENT